MSNVAALCKALKVDVIHGIDFETYYDNKYSLRGMATTDYIFDPRFEMQLAAIKTYARGKLQNTRVLAGVSEFKKWVATIDPSRSAMLGHHVHFDGLIAARAGATFKAYVDTLTIANATMSVAVARDLASLCGAFGRKSKKRAGALVAVKGKRLAELTKAELHAFKLYAQDDIEDTWFLLEKMLPFMPLEQAQWADIVLQAYTRPVFTLNEDTLRAVQSEEVQRKAALLERLNVDKKALMSNDLFAGLLRSLDVEPPQKVSERTGEIGYAFSKTDPDFKALLEHSDENVVALVEARLDIKSTSVETRATRLISRVSYGAQPVYLKPFGAKTQRLAGGDKVNWQNMKRGSGVRRAITAPKGYSFIIADQSQIEARLNAYCAGETRKLEAFANNEDVYSLTAGDIYSRKITKEHDPVERFVGKVCELALGYSAGWPKFANMLRLGVYGPPMPIDDREAERIVKAWRKTNRNTANNWRATYAQLRVGFLGKTPTQHNVITYQGVRSGKSLNGYAVLPSGLCIRYDDLHDTVDSLTYLSKRRFLKDGTTRDERTRLYGGIAVENQMQALANIVVSDCGTSIIGAHGAGGARIVLQVHDELVFVVPTRRAKSIARDVHDIMVTPPAWAPDIPLGCDVHISTVYDK